MQSICYQQNDIQFLIYSSTMAPFMHSVDYFIYLSILRFCNLCHRLLKRNQTMYHKTSTPYGEAPVTIMDLPLLTVPGRNHSA